MFSKILVPLDGSDLAERALEPAYSLARQQHASTILLRAVEPERIFVLDSHAMGGYSPIWPSQSLELSRTAAQSYFKTLSTRVPAGVDARTALADGDPAEVIVEAAAAENADLIVMSSHGYSGITRWILGSVAERVLHDAGCPVLIVRSVEPMRHILVPLDGSALSEQVLAPALSIAGSLGCKVTLLRAGEIFDRTEIEKLDHVEPGLGRHMQEDLHRDVELYLTKVAAAHQGLAPEITSIVMHGPPANSILEYAQAHRVDLIAMSTHGRTGLKRWVYGSVTEKILRAAGCCSMLVVRPASQFQN